MRAISTTFKQFISEASVSAPPQYANIEIEKAVSVLNTNCKNALWMLEKNRPIYRGEKNFRIGSSGFATVDTSATERRSQNTKNYYSLILDNNPLAKDFPKRTRSFIATTDKWYASSYAGIGDDAESRVLTIIPYDDAKIGVANTEDIWSTYISLFGHSKEIEVLNDFFMDLDLPQTSDSFLKTFKDFDLKLKNGDEESINKLIKACKRHFHLNEDYVKAKIAPSFIEQIWEAYSPKSTGFSWYYTSNMPHDLRETEVWVSGKVILISQSMWVKLLDTFKKK